MALALGPVIGQIGGGGGVEEIPVSMSGSGNGTVYPLTTVNAGDGALIAVAGTLTPGSNAVGSTPQIQIGSHFNSVTDTQSSAAAIASGSVTIAVRSRAFTATTFSGTVYVARL